MRKYLGVAMGLALLAVGLPPASGAATTGESWTGPLSTCLLYTSDAADE